ncbi:MULTISPECIES: RagB/SusD family nutrient uptake outer membrane protein [Aequorivita]|uniref:Starch-binding protein n=2 Tax=Aequorivita TaxID=153265 RepID=A0ABR5DKL2_9FLAO|nr:MULTISPECIES: RagB/SusD family nutrient uptake outer membrane protein [Aequorivita]KJJ39314.1 starch-binding protein [Aequorivita vladivostokensis]MBT0608048.1 RagB/SusD family nutrient uptake outer membrane protein [Aequorivita echinoideorum]
MKKAIHYHIKKYIYLLLCPLLFLGCEDFLEAEDPLGQLNSPLVFEDEATATAAVTTLYAKLRDEVLLTGNTQGLGLLMGIYADEMDYYGFGGEPLDSFYQHQVFSDDVIAENLWTQSYALIYMGNAILEGLETSQILSAESKAQLRGEVLFIRALSYFYLVNLYGDIPYAITTNYEVNSILSRMPASQVYENIVIDLNESKTLLGTNYISGERTRVNSMGVSALLARIYLYTEQWNAAEMEASAVINNTSLYNLETEVSNEFLKESPSAILQFKPKTEGNNTLEASTFIFTAGPPPLVSLEPQLIEGMEADDQRREQWIGEVTDGSQTWYYPNKYQNNSNTGTSMEYSIVFRISEQYLIRAEAKAKLGNLPDALEDLNTIRNRAGLMDSEATTQNEILEAIFQERYHELFSEFGHRWFDLKRLGLANEILAPIKPGWKPTDVLLPIPENELLMNPNLYPQNPGY